MLEDLGKLQDSSCS